MPCAFPWPIMYTPFEAASTMYTAHFDKGWCGIVLKGPNDGPITVVTVRSGSPAAAAGVRPGDVLVSVNDDENFTFVSVINAIATGPTTIVFSRAC